jgi:hypothetical protein
MVKREGAWELGSLGAKRFGIVGICQPSSTGASGVLEWWRTFRPRELGSLLTCEPLLQMESFEKRLVKSLFQILL